MVDPERSEIFNCAPDELKNSIFPESDMTPAEDRDDNDLIAIEAEPEN
ncbi:hypothetical protein [Salmonella bongori]|nr:hypothetical protein [Salmonella bongori]EGS1128441.1 hypothetical protein [Salmonella bongori CFSAN000509]EHM2232087.1 hypothetical protein [Salmonella bongori]EIT4623105.1 hypothetical protein [Salmonella bongori]MBA3225017.1 hypothetical protein [Salmonella bongori]